MDELYDEDWIEFYDNLIPEHHYKKSFSILLHLINKYNPNAKHVLELACGTGRYTHYFVRHGFTVKGIDISRSALHVANIRVRRHAEFHHGDMTRIKEPPKFDIVACMFESFRYHTSFTQALNTLKRAYNALAPKGIFFCDFGIFPPSRKQEDPQMHDEVKISKGRTVIRDEFIFTKGHFDMRTDKVKVIRKKSFRKPDILLEKELKRAPLLRISEHEMKTMMEKAGFKNIEVHHFTGDRSRLFIGQKN